MLICTENNSFFALLDLWPKVLHLTAVSLLAIAVAIGTSVARADDSAAFGTGIKFSEGRVDVQLFGAPPAITSEEKERRERMLDRTHLPTPMPEAESGPTNPVAGTMSLEETKPMDGADNSGQTYAPAASPGTFSIFRSSVNQLDGAVPLAGINEPQAATSASVSFMTGNWFASYSTNGGQTFTYVDPETAFPPIDGGFCCDQTVVYDSSRDLFTWQLQYIYSSTTHKGSYRTAFANSSQVAAGSWCYYNWDPRDFGLGQDLWLDYPNVALSDNYVWYTANIFNSSDTYQNTVIWRIPLASAASCNSLSYSYYVHGGGTTVPVQGAASRMYFASHNSTSSIRIYTWPESSGITYVDVLVPAWTDPGREGYSYSCPGPDGRNTCGRIDGRIMTGWVAGGVIGFMWIAGQDSSYPYPYTYVARFNESTKALIDAPIIWSNEAAWIFPAVSINNRGHLGGTIHYAGGNYYPSMCALILDDYSSSPWDIYLLARGERGTDSQFGDYYSSRKHGSHGNTWVITGETIASEGTVQPRYVWFGRERDNPGNRKVKNDFNGDGMSDILWRNTSTGWNWLYYMDGANVSSNGGINRIADTNWKIVGTGDYNGDGSPDLLWRHQLTGVLWMFLMNNNHVIGNLPVTVIPDLNWHVKASGDFDGDGKDDIFLRHAVSGVNWVYLMDGASIATSKGLNTISDLGWEVKGAGDFDGDGKDDILWRHKSNGQNHLFLMDGARVGASQGINTLADSNWKVVGVGDYNGDGKSDILWRHALSGVNWLYLMNGSKVASSAGINTLSDGNWRVSGTGDYNGDGKADILWRHAVSGAIWMYLMDGENILASQPVGVMGNLNWQIISPN